MERIHDIYRDTDERKHDFKEVERRIPTEDIRKQVTRCMNCGQPFCHGYGYIFACELGRNQIELGNGGFHRYVESPLQDSCKGLFCGLKHS